MSSEQNRAPLVARCGYTHLFSGARLAIEHAGPSREPGLPSAFVIRFRDGGTAAAVVLDEVVPGLGGAGRIALDVAGHSTAAGTDIPRTIWEVRAVGAGPADDEIVLGRRLHRSGCTRRPPGVLSE